MFMKEFLQRWFFPEKDFAFELDQQDVDIIRNASLKNPDLLTGQRFLQNIVIDDKLGALFQQFLSSNSLSSHAWVIGKVPS